MDNAAPYKAEAEKAYIDIVERAMRARDLASRSAADAWHLERLAGFVDGFLCALSAIETMKAPKKTKSLAREAIYVDFKERIRARVQATIDPEWMIFK